MIICQKAKTKEKTKIVVLEYRGEGDPVYHLDQARQQFLNKNYKEFVDINMDNPWIRILIKEKK